MDRAHHPSTPFRLAEAASVLQCGGSAEDECTIDQGDERNFLILAMGLLQFCDGISVLAFEDLCAMPVCPVPEHQSTSLTSKSFALAAAASMKNIGSRPPPALSSCRR